MEGDEILGLLERAVVVVEVRQSKLEKLDEAILLSAGAREQATKDRIVLIRKVKSSDAQPADRLRHLILYVNNQIAEIDEMLESLRRA
jgi:hypothetical protein